MRGHGRAAGVREGVHRGAGRCVAARRAQRRRLLADWTDVASGAKADRPQLAEALASLRPGDTLCVWRLDRLGRSLPHLIETVRELEERGVGFRSVQESIDTSTPGGRLVFHVFGALAAFERDLVQERTRAGLDAARRRGRTGGRPPALTPAKAKQARKMRAEGASLDEIAGVVGVPAAATGAALTRVAGVTS